MPSQPDRTTPAGPTPAMEGHPLEITSFDPGTQVDASGEPNHAVEQEVIEDVEVDLRLLDYVSDYDRNLACPICRCPFIDAISLPCDHSYCRLCYYKALEAQDSDTKQCPTCRRNISSEPSPVPRFAQHLVDELKVGCPNKGFGCTKEIRRDEVQAHVSYHCSQTRLNCPDRSCSYKVPRRRNNGSCRHTKRKCLECQQTLCELDMKDHMHRRCEVATFQCEDCQSGFQCSERGNHARSCPERSVACTAAKLGCTVRKTPATVTLHVRSCPLVRLLPTVDALTKRIDDHDARVASLETRNAILQGSFDNIRDIVDVDPARTAPQHRIESFYYPHTPLSQEPAQDIPQDLQVPPFDSAAQHVLSLHETLREEVDRVSAAIAEVDGKASMTIINETLRLREDMARQNAAISSLTMQVQWLMQQRLQTTKRGPGSSAASSSAAASSASAATPASSVPVLQPVRRLSDPSRADVKL